MVKQVLHEGLTLYQCEECNMLYEDKALAERCEEWCRKRKGCNTDIVKFAFKE